MNSNGNASVVVPGSTFFSVAMVTAALLGGSAHTRCASATGVEAAEVSRAAADRGRDPSSSAVSDTGSARTNTDETSATVFANVLRVGQSQRYTSIQQAIDAAMDGDVIVVDPGTYLPFDVAGKGLTILSSGGPTNPFGMRQTTHQPAVRVRNLKVDQAVTVMHFTVAYANSSAPALSLENCVGCVSIADVFIDPVADLVDSAARGAIEVRNCRTAWFRDLVVRSTARRRGNTIKPPGRPIVGNGGLCAMVASDSGLLLDHVVLRGFDNSVYQNGTSFGGDALRLVGSCQAWIVHRPGSGSNVLEGGAGLTFGGSAVHVVGTPPQTDVEVCGPTQLLRGTGSTRANQGGLLAVNNDRGMLAVGPQVTVERTVPTCILEAYGAITLAPSTVPPGGRVQVTISTLLPRFAWVAVGPELALRPIPGVQGLAMLDFSAPSTALLAARPVSQVPATLSVPVPNIAGLIGWRLGVQGVLGPPTQLPGSGLSLTLPAFTVLTL